MYAGRENGMFTHTHPTFDRIDRDLITEPSPSADWRTVYAANEVPL